MLNLFFYAQHIEFNRKCSVQIGQKGSNKSHLSLYSSSIKQNWILQSFSQDYILSFSHHLCCVWYFYTWVVGPTVYSRLRTTDFWRNFSWQLYLLSQRANRRSNIFIFCFDVSPGSRTLDFVTQYLKPPLVIVAVIYIGDLFVLLSWIVIHIGKKLFFFLSPRWQLW